MTARSETTAHPIALNDVRDAAAALGGVVARTPLLENPDVNEALGGRLLIKAECAQRTGAFKIRGAYYRILRMSAAERARGAITYSSGNHALGVARAAQLLGSSALIVMPDDVPPEEKERRRKALDDLQAEIVREINARLVGQTVEVLVEGQKKARPERGRGERWWGRTRTDKLVFFEDEGDWRGRLARVRVTWAGPWSLVGEVCDSKTGVPSP